MVIILEDFSTDFLSRHEPYPGSAFIRTMKRIETACYKTQTFHLVTSLFQEPKQDGFCWWQVNGTGDPLNKDNDNI